MADALQFQPTPRDLNQRLGQLSAAAQRRGLDAVVVAPGADMAYFLGNHVASHERLTALVVPAVGEPTLVVPTLERPGWQDSSAERMGLSIVTWTDGVNAHALVRDLLPTDTRTIGVDNYMPSMHSLGIRDAVAGSQVVVADDAIAELRMRKTADEVAALMAVGAAIDRVHRRMGEWLRPGRTELEVAADVAEAIVAEGHRAADFVIVASGPHGASPHHEASDRVIGEGELVVVDIGGPAPSGYNSDSTRTYLTAGGNPEPEAMRVYEVVRRAQAAGVAAATVGASAESVDAAARAVIEAAGYGDQFITRTGHGIGLEVHEQPYLVAGNEMALDVGMAFSVEPGIYLPGRFGVRIEDIVVVTEDGPQRCNTAPTELVIVG